MTKRMRMRNKRRAFTLLEVLMVVVILGVLAALVIPQFVDVGDKAKISTTESTIKGMRSVMETFRASVGRYPKTLQELSTKPEDEREAKNWVMLIKDPSELKDAWQYDLIYVSPGNVNKDSYDLSSPGPDHQPGTEDDITNWKRQ